MGDRHHCRRPASCRSLPSGPVLFFRGDARSCPGLLSVMRGKYVAFSTFPRRWGLLLVASVGTKAPPSRRHTAIMGSGMNTGLPLPGQPPASWQELQEYLVVPRKKIKGATASAGAARVESPSLLLASG